MPPLVSNAGSRGMGSPSRSVQVLRHGGWQDRRVGEGSDRLKHEEKEVSIQYTVMNSLAL